MESTISSIHIGQLKVPYNVEWSNERETIGLKVNSQKEVEVTSPTEADKDEIEDTLEEKKSWILEKINRVEEESWPPKDKEFLTGEKILYRGRRYPIKVVEGDETTIEFSDETFSITSENYGEDHERRKEVARELKKWYKKQASVNLTKRAYDLAEEVNESPENVEVVDYENKWGENVEDTIKLHWRLIMAPQDIQDYVIAHEICHLHIKNHSDTFWNMLGTIIPRYQEKRAWLRKNAGKLTI